jgi:hypothetical protein
MSELRKINAFSTKRIFIQEALLCSALLDGQDFETESSLLDLGE